MKIKLDINFTLNLAKKRISQLDADLLLAHVLGTSREFLLIHPEKKLTIWESMRFLYLINKRARNIPIAHLTHKQLFYAFEFYINKHVLVPRPATEQIVDLAVSAYMTNQQAAPPIIDVGTGSGCIAISIAKILEEKTNSEVCVIATDMSKKALKVADINIEKLDANVTTKQGNLLEPIVSDIPHNSTVIICANLPYLTPTQIESEKSIQKEPRGALLSGEGGLDHYREFFSQLLKLSRQKVFKSILFIEFEPTQKDVLEGIVSDKFTSSKFTPFVGLNNQVRVARIDIPSNQ